MSEELFIKMLAYLNYMFANNSFDENGNLNYLARHYKTLPWGKQNEVFKRPEQQIMYQFIRNVKVNDIPLFLYLPLMGRVKCFYNTYAPVERVLIQAYETLTRKKFDRRKLINDVQHFGR